MKKQLLLASMALLCACTPNQNEWKLVWEDQFDQPTGMDTTTWSKIPRVKVSPEWRKYMSDNENCYEVKEGNLILRGIKNPNRDQDTATYLTGGVYTKYKRGFYNGRLEIRAKLDGARGAWPAIWMKPSDEDHQPWPSGGEIDIMERLNYDSIAYQTVHSNYTHRLGIKDHPRSGVTAPIRPDDYNVYALEMYPDSLVFFINDVKSFTYPRIETDKQGQYPFDQSYYLLIDMQLGGGWVGGIDAKDIPVEMKIDWVRFYQKGKK